MLAENFSQGEWKNLIEMEDSLTLDELYLLRNALYEAEHRRNKFAAALKGIDIDEDSESSSDFEEVQRRVQADLGGKSEQEFVFDMIGIEIEDDDE
jgi:hypothetical protein